MEGMTNYHWMAQPLDDVLLRSFAKAQAPQQSLVENFDLFDLERQRVDPTAMLLQIGLLSLAPASPKIPAAVKAERSDDLASQLMMLRAPNQYARNSLLQLLSKYSHLEATKLSAQATKAYEAVKTRDYKAFGACMKELLESIPHSMTSVKGFVAQGAADGTVADVNTKDNITPAPREAPYHTCLYGFLRAALPHDLCNLMVEQEGAWGSSADVVVELGARSEAEKEAVVWIIEIGVITPGGQRTTKQLVKEKKEQTARYRRRYASWLCMCCVVVIDRNNKNIEISWEQHRPESNGAEGQVLV
jgi:hypothetical protein